MDCDIYEDLDFDFGKRFEELEKQNKELTQYVEKLECLIKTVTDEVAQVKQINEVLKINISELYKTAKAEIGRKDRMVSEVRKELDDILCNRKNGIPNKDDKYNTLLTAYERMNEEGQQKDKLISKLKHKLELEVKKNEELKMASTSKRHLTDTEENEDRIAKKPKLMRDLPSDYQDDHRNSYRNRYHSREYSDEISMPRYNYNKHDSYKGYNARHRYGSKYQMYRQDPGTSRDNYHLDYNYKQKHYSSNNQDHVYASSTGSDSAERYNKNKDRNFSEPKEHKIEENSLKGLPCRSECEFKNKVEKHSVTKSIEAPDANYNTASRLKVADKNSTSTENLNELNLDDNVSKSQTNKTKTEKSTTEEIIPITAGPEEGEITETNMEQSKELCASVTNINIDKDVKLKRKTGNKIAKYDRVDMVNTDKKKVVIKIVKERKRKAKINDTPEKVTEVVKLAGEEESSSAVKRKMTQELKILQEKINNLKRRSFEKDNKKIVDCITTDIKIVKEKKVEHLEKKIPEKDSKQIGDNVIRDTKVGYEQKLELLKKKNSEKYNKKIDDNVATDAKVVETKNLETSKTKNSEKDSKKTYDNVSTLGQKKFETLKKKISENDSKKIDDYNTTITKVVDEKIVERLKKETSDKDSKKIDENVAGDTQIADVKKVEHLKEKHAHKPNKKDQLLNEKNGNNELKLEKSEQLSEKSEENLQKDKSDKLVKLESEKHETSNILADSNKKVENLEIKEIKTEAIEMNEITDLKENRIDPKLRAQKQEKSEIMEAEKICDSTKTEFTNLDEYHVLNENFKNASENSINEQTDTTDYHFCRTPIIVEKDAKISNEGNESKGAFIKPIPPNKIIDMNKIHVNINNALVKSMQKVESDKPSNTVNSLADSSNTSSSSTVQRKVTGRRRRCVISIK